MDFRFPDSFVWGAASSAYQIEAACDAGGKMPTVYDYYSKAKPDMFQEGGGPENAADFYHRYREDIAIMKKYGLKSFRFSICWARIQSAVMGAPNEDGIAYYNGVIDCLMENGVIPFFDLYHCDLPMFVIDKGGPTNPEFVDWFTDYARICFRAFGERVKYWSVVNEPVLNVYGAYARENNGPFGNSMKDGLAASYHMMLAHYKTIKLYREMGFDGKIGAVNHFIPTYAKTRSREDQEAAERYREFYAGWWMEPMIKGTYPELILREKEVRDLMPEGFAQGLRDAFEPMDFIGINYYNPAIIAYDPEGELRYRRLRDTGLPKDDYGFDRYLPSMFDTLMYVKNHYGNIPIFITENGIGMAPPEDPLEDINDLYRVEYLREALRELNRCMKAGVNVQGYYHWTFLDTYEGNTKGYKVRFGLVRIDTKTLERIPRKSLDYYRDVIESGFVE